MTSRSTAISIALTALGALPFYLILIAPSEVARIIMVDPHSAYRSYGAVIGSFMAGTLWGFSQPASRTPIVAVVLSNILALAVWSSLLIPLEAFRGWLWLQLIVFWALLAIDWSLWRSGLERDWYLRLRVLVTTAVSIAYLCAIFFW